MAIFVTHCGVCAQALVVALIMKNKSYKYENIQIGNFLISIGYYLRDFKYKHPMSVNLHQQTPNDFTIGDLFGAFAGKFFIIEFKNSEDSLKDELKKNQRIRLIKRLNNELSQLAQISAKGHFICYPKFLNEEMEFILNPYITILNEKYKHLQINNVGEFILKILKDKSIGVDFKEIKQYINLLKKCSIEEGNKSSGGISSGIIINFEKDKGIKYFAFDDLDFLNQKIRLEKEIQEMTKNIERTKDKGRNFGMSM